MVPLLFKSSRGLIKWKPAEIDVKQRCDAANKFRRIEANRDTHNWISLPGNTKLSMWLIAAVSIDTEKYHIRIDWAEKKKPITEPITKSSRLASQDDRRSPLRWQRIQSTDNQQNKEDNDPSDANKTSTSPYPEESLVFRLWKTSVTSTRRGV